MDIPPLSQPGSSTVNDVSTAVQHEAQSRSTEHRQSQGRACTYRESVGASSGMEASHTTRHEDGAPGAACGSSEGKGKGRGGAHGHPCSHNPGLARTRSTPASPLRYSLPTPRPRHFHSLHAHASESYTAPRLAAGWHAHAHEQRRAKVEIGEGGWAPQGERGGDGRTREVKALPR